MNRKHLIILITFLGLSFQGFTQGNLLITPKRVVFDGNKQSEELSLVNTGKDTATYSISFLQYNMQEDGGVVIIQKPDSGQMFADPYLRIFPRQVTLAPGEPQVIMLQCRRTPGMQAGEYRSHLHFRPNKEHLQLGMKKPADTTLFSVQLVPIYGISIPIIIHSGAVNVNVTLSNLKSGVQQDGAQYIYLTLNRTGNISLYGDLKLQFIPANGKPFEIEGKRGIGIYTNINKRNVTIKLNSAQAEKFKNGKLKVQFISNEENKKPVVYADGELEVK